MVFAKNKSQYWNPLNGDKIEVFLLKNSKRQKRALKLCSDLLKYQSLDVNFNSVWKTTYTYSPKAKILKINHI